MIKYQSKTQAVILVPHINLTDELNKELKRIEETYKGAKPITLPMPNGSLLIQWNYDVEVEDKPVMIDELSRDIVKIFITAPDYVNSADDKRKQYAVYNLLMDQINL